MDLDELLNIVRESGMISADAILDAIKTKNQNRNMELNYRGFLSQYNTYIMLKPIYLRFNYYLQTDVYLNCPTILWVDILVQLQLR